MKKIIIVSQGMEIGGAEKALLGLLESIDSAKIQVDLFLLRHTGELLKYIPKYVTILPEKKEYSMLAVPLKETLKNGMYTIFWRRIKGKLMANIYAHRHHFCSSEAVEDEYSHRYALKCMPQISEKEYDLAISFLAPHYFVCEKVQAKKTMAWIHTDYKSINIDVNSEEKMWEKYDYICSISESITQGFLIRFPSLENKVILFKNIMPVKYIRNLANFQDVGKEMPRDGNIIMLSIGRFCTPKNFDNVPEICSRILKLGIKIKWYLIGYGPDEELIKSKIKEYGMENNVFILGKKENPYPYIKRCDVYVQPSRYEGKSMSVIEAQMFNKPVIITNYASAESQLENGIDGVIVPMENKNCAKKIVEVLCDKTFQNKLIDGTKSKEYANIDEVEQLYKILGI